MIGMAKLKGDHAPSFAWVKLYDADATFRGKGAILEPWSLVQSFLLLFSEVRMAPVLW